MRQTAQLLDAPGTRGHRSCHLRQQQGRRQLQVRASERHTASATSSSLLSQLAAAALSTSLLLAPAQPCVAAAPAPDEQQGGELSIAFPASARPDIREAQKTLVEAWAYTDTLFVEPPPHDVWAKALQEALAASFKAESGREVTQLTRDLLATLNDPYTRLLQEEEQSALAAEEEGKVVSSGLGLQQVSVPAQQLVVSFVVDGSPAAQAGVKEGDAVLAVAEQDVTNKDLRDVYKLLSQETDVTLAREPPSTGADTYTVHLKPMPLEFEAAQYGIIDLSKQARAESSSPAGTSSSSSSAAGRVGYLKLLTFSATAPQAVAEALRDMQQEASQQPGAQPLSGLIVDLRDNPGGIVEAGVDISQDFLRAGDVLCVVVDKTGQEERVVLPEAHTLTDLPLVVLVNHSTASTSELLAGALHDELHAPLIGTTTYGKGRTQRVIRLADAKSTLLVSTLKYFTPQHSAIDGVGLQPDVVCKPDEVLGKQWRGGRVGEEEGSDYGSLLDDPCVKLAAAQLTSAA